ncbi:hypothetical protein EII20_13590 [Comamonadaceae bacterium OH2545_COT-014]|nr:hypothetical protein EII20_13590 [Comamonadaceae bacterium OH2545_COT-014]
MSIVSRTFHRLPLASALLATLYAAPALAANVDLTSTVTAPSSLNTLKPFQLTVRYGNGPGGAATNAQVAIPLPANLYDVSVASVNATGGAVCPGVGDIQDVPTALTTNATTPMTATIASLPGGGTCEITFNVTALTANTYTFRAQIQPGAGDTEAAPATNNSQTNVTITKPKAEVSVEKTIVSGATRTGTGTNNLPQWRATGHEIVYKLTYTNHSPDLDLPLSVLQDQWTDGESHQTLNRLKSATTVLGGLGKQGCEKSNPDSVCPTLTPINAPNYSAGSATPLAMNLVASKAVLKANSSIDIYYTRTYEPATCGEVKLRNGTQWQVNTRNNALDVTLRNGGYSAVETTFPQAKPCVGITIKPEVTKTLDKVTRADGSDAPLSKKGNFLISEDGDTAHFTITLKGDATHTLPVRIADGLRNLTAGSNQPTFYPKQANVGGVDKPSVRYTLSVDSCQIAGGTPGAQKSTCPGGEWQQTGGAPKVLVTDRSASENYGSKGDVTMTLGAAETITLKLSLKYNVSHPDPASGLKLCRANLDNIANYLEFIVSQDAVLEQGQIYEGGAYLRADTTKTPLELLTDNTPRCVNLTAAKTLSNTTPKAGEPFEFHLDYTNNTSDSTRVTIPAASPHNAASVAEINPLKDLVVTDELGSHFEPEAVSCKVTSDPTKHPATAPTVSLADITGPNNTFKATIPSMDSGAVVRCTIRGKVNAPGSYANITRIDLPASNTALAETVLTDNEAKQNYPIVGPEVNLTKVIDGATPFTPGGPITYVITATNISATEPADGTVISDTFPPELQNPSWECVAAGGAACPNANGAANLNETIATFPVGGSLTYTVKGTVDAAAISIVNTAQATPRAGLGGFRRCSTDPNAAAAPNCTSTAAAGAGANAPHVTIAKKAGAATVAADGTATFTVEATAVGAHAANGAKLADPMAADFESQEWTCTATGGAVCPNANGNGNIDETIATFPAGGKLTYTVTAKAKAGLAANRDITNTASITPPAGGTCEPASASATACSAEATVRTPPPPPAGNVTAVPVNSPWMLLSLMALVAGLAGGMARRQRR